VAKKPVDPAKAKQAKQKRLVIILAVVFVLAMAYAVNTMMGLNSGGGAKPSAAPPTPVTSSTTTPTSTPTSTPSTATTAPTLAGSGTTTTPASTDSSSLVAVVTPSADPGQLESFSRFSSKDPFDSQGPKSGGASSSGSSGSGGSGTSGSSGHGGGGGKTPKTPPAPPTPPPTTAVLSVNGTEESVPSGSDFPSSNPIFQLVALTSTTAQVGIAGGSYDTGQATITLTVNKPLTLVNTADGTRYTLLLLPQGTVPPQGSSSSSGSSTTTPTTTTPTTTTPTTTTPSGP